MAKFSGKVGFATQEPKSEGSDVYVDVISERTYRGDVLRNSNRWDTGNTIHDDLQVKHRISILADAYANNYFEHIRYVVWRNSKWKVSLAEIEYPRIILSLGGIYNGPTP